MIRLNMQLRAKLTSLDVRQTFNDFSTWLFGELSFKFTYATLVVCLTCAIILIPSINNIAFVVLVICYAILVFKNYFMNKQDLICLLIILFLFSKQTLHLLASDEFDLTATFKYICYPIIIMGARRIVLKPAHIQIIKFTVISLLTVGLIQHFSDKFGYWRMREIAPKGTLSSANITAAVLLNFVIILKIRKKLETILGKLTMMTFVVYKSAATIPAVLLSVFAVRSKFFFPLLGVIGAVSLTFVVNRVKTDLFPNLKISTIINVLEQSEGVGLGSFFWRVWAWYNYIKDPSLLEWIAGYSLGATSKVSPLFQFTYVGQDPHNSLLILFFEYGLIAGMMMLHVIWRYGYRPACSSLTSTMLLPLLVFLALFFGNAFASKEYFVSLALLFSLNIQAKR